MYFEHFIPETQCVLKAGILGASCNTQGFSMVKSMNLF